MKSRPDFFKLVCLFLSLIILTFGCSTGPGNNPSNQNDADYLHHFNKRLTDVIVEDIFNPPVASRCYAYPNIAAYEAIIAGNPDFRSLAGQINGLKPLPEPDPELDYDFTTSGIIAFSRIAQELIYSKYILQEEEESYLKERLGQLGDKAKLDRSVDFGESIAKAISQYIADDNYGATRAMKRHTLNSSRGTWEPTPPDFMGGIEPNWKMIRPFTLDSATQFIPPPPTAFDSSETSLFFKEAMEVYHTVKNLDEEQLETAKFWDCNPNASVHQGHFMYFIKKITPGGHWMGITTIACMEENLPIERSAETYALTSIALADAFISCWDEKYRSILIRPETYINRYIDKDWEPILQTPAFPEYTSGHSVASASGATILTHLFGEPFHFVDSTEVRFGLPVNEYPSFRAASEEAAISRLYGGIHYMPAITHGISQGNKVGEQVLEKVKTRVSSDN